MHLFIRPPRLPSLQMKQLFRNLSGVRRFSLSAISHASPPQSPQSTSVPRWEDSEELIADYDPSVNGYYPLKIGDVLGGHYTIVQKLGWGVYSTVWLAKDQRCAFFNHC